MEFKAKECEINPTQTYLFASFFVSKTKKNYVTTVKLTNTVSYPIQSWRTTNKRYKKRKETNKKKQTKIKTEKKIQFKFLSKKRTFSSFFFKIFSFFWHTKTNHMEN